MNDVRLVLLETSGNQTYIFGTNKMREIMGASELTYRVGTRYVEAVVEEVFNREFKVMELLAEPSLESPAAKGVEVITATSGKALLLIEGEKNAKQFIQEWSLSVIRDAPGVDATGVISSEAVDMDMDGDSGGRFDIASAMRDVHERFEEARAKRTPLQDRFQRLPVVAECNSSGGPAAMWYVPKTEHQSEEDPAPLSRESIVKRDARASDDFKNRFSTIYDKDTLSELSMDANKFKDAHFDNPYDMEKGLSDLEWVGVVHADGNGLGQVFLVFGEWIRAVEKLKDGLTDNQWLSESTLEMRFSRKFVDAYRRISVRLDEITRRAYLRAVYDVLVQQRTDSRRIPLVPVILGGDDMTMMVDGRLVIPFTKRFLEAHQDEVRNDNGALKAILTAASSIMGAPRFGMSAGIAIVKPHFPFSVAYNLAEDLVGSAKSVKKYANKASSAIDFHILYDSSASSMEGIREKLFSLDRKALLTAKPYIVKRIGNVTDDEWCKGHDWSVFEKAVKALKARDISTNKPLIPPTQTHALRETLHTTEPKTVENGLWRILMKRYQGFAKKWRVVISGGDHADDTSSPPLFVQRPSVKQDDQTDKMTVFQDAIEAKDFL